MAKEGKGNGSRRGRVQSDGKLTHLQSWMCRSRLGDLFSAHAAQVVSAKFIVTRSWIVTRVFHGIAEGCRESASAKAFRNRVNRIVGGWRPKLDITSWDGSWLEFTDASVGFAIGETSKGLPLSTPLLKANAKRNMIEARENLGCA